ncbi:MAG: hypothetical protein ACEY3M_07910, partial [Wolbachia sp.]
LIHNMQTICLDHPQFLRYTTSTNYICLTLYQGKQLTDSSFTRALLLHEVLMNVALAKKISSHDTYIVTSS